MRCQVESTEANLSAPVLDHMPKKQYLYLLIIQQMHICHILLFQTYNDFFNINKKIILMWIKSTDIFQNNYKMNTDET